ncbi:MAG: hydroxyacylglutathione hydrolase [Alphaproteobacteria bacterium]|nr:hydroxyacylglutathione hydrolase [Alphaproteobacteria bacterium]MBE8220118.1 hydroxyacylglutathione hydrolase [Alphaproteobacteria bacterium]
MSDFEVCQIPCLQDNYGYLIHHPKSGQTACIDTPETQPILTALQTRGWDLTYIWNTHHHHDHAGNNEEIKAQTGCTIIGPAGEADKIPAIDKAVDDGDAITLGDMLVQIFNVGGHTLGHIAYYIPEAHLAFVGDSLFALGCGRIFEGTPQQMWQSLQKLNALPDGTKIYCAHEYTQANATFAITIEPDNIDLQKRVQAISEARTQGQPTIPTEIALERATNPFLRPHSAAIRAHLNMTAASDVEVFAAIRRQKDNF